MTAEDFQANCGHLLLWSGVLNSRRHTCDAQAERIGHIFQVSSVGGRLGFPGNTPYHAAKWAVGGFSDSLAMEVAPFGVKVCILEPGGIRTNWARRAGQNAPDLLPEYEASVGPMLKILRSLEGRAEGDSFPKAELIESSGDKAREKRPLLNCQSGTAIFAVTCWFCGTECAR